MVVILSQELVLIILEKNINILMNDVTKQGKYNFINTIKVIKKFKQYLL